MTATHEIAIFGAGCFWGVEQAFRQLDGVVEAEVGYCGGSTPSPTYRDVCSGTTGHAEVVRVTFDPPRVSYRELLDLFWTLHDPTQLNRQGPDVGTQYRSVIVALSPEQEKAALASRTELDASGAFPRPITTEIVPAATFWRAEDYHQRYFAKRGLAACHTR